MYSAKSEIPTSCTAATAADAGAAVAAIAAMNPKANHLGWCQNRRKSWEKLPLPQLVSLPDF